MSTHMPAHMHTRMSARMAKRMPARTPTTDRRLGSASEAYPFVPVPRRAMHHAVAVPCRAHAVPCVPIRQVRTRTRHRAPAQHGRMDMAVIEKVSYPCGSWRPKAGGEGHVGLN